MKKTKKKRKLKKIRFLFLLFFIVGISFAFIKLFDVRIYSIKIKGNKILTDQEIIETAKLEDYPSFFETLSYTIKKRLLKNNYIESVKVTKGFLSVNITIKEKKILYIDKETNYKYTYNSKFKDDKSICVPYLIGSVPEGKMKRFIKAMNKINSDMICQMSEIKYDPNDIDEDRYYVYMNDGNSVYLTVNKFDKINKYNTILEKIGKQNGTLYLDYGDYFEAK